MPGIERAEPPPPPPPQPALEPGDEGRLAKPLLQPSGDDADDARMPSLACDEHEGLIVVRHRHRDRFIENELLDGLPFAVMRVERDGILLSSGSISRRQEIDAKATSPDAPSGVDARSEDKSQMVRRKGWSRRSNACKRRQTRSFQLRKFGETNLHKSAVDARERHDITNGRQPHEIQIFTQIRFGLGGERAGCPQRTIQGNQEQKHDPSGTDIPLPRRISRLVRIDMRKCLGLALDRMMIQHDNVQTGIVRRR
jgi:hypothetical protein